MESASIVLPAGPADGIAINALAFDVEFPEVHKTVILFRIDRPLKHRHRRWYHTERY